MITFYDVPSIVSATRNEQYPFRGWRIDVNVLQCLNNVEVVLSANWLVNCTVIKQWDVYNIILPGVSNHL